MDAAGDHCKDPLQNLHSPSETPHIPNGQEETHQILEDDEHPQLRFCSTSCVCMIIGVTIAFGSIAMTACSYFADVLARETILSGNVTEIIIDEHLRVKLTNFRTIGPVLIGLGIFFMLCACVLLCEARDRLKKSCEESEKILPMEYHLGDPYRTAESIRAETLAITPDIEFPLQSSSSQDSESSSPMEDEGNDAHMYRASELPTEERQGSPVVLVHGIASIDDSCSKSSQELPIRTDSLKRSKEADVRSETKQTSDDSSPTKCQSLQDSPIRKLPKLQLPPPSPPKPPRLLELSPSKLPGSNSVFPKPVMVKPVKLPPIQQSENGPVVQQKTATNNQMLQTDFPSPCSSCDPSPVRVPRGTRPNKKKILEKYPTDTFLLRNLSPRSGDPFSTNNSSNNLPQRTEKENKPFRHNEMLNPEEATLHSDTHILHKSGQNTGIMPMETSGCRKGYMETCIDTPDNINIIENRPTALCNVSPSTAKNQRNQNGGQNGGSLPDSEQDSSLRDTNSNITGSTASVHSRNSNQSPNRSMAVNNKREVVLV